jgi:hypothetical protein
MPTPSVVGPILHKSAWLPIVVGPVEEVQVTGEAAFFYVWATSQPAMNSVIGHYVPARKNEPMVCQAGMTIWGRAESTPSELTITVEPVA